jgi:hypothetical protein
MQSQAAKVSVVLLVISAVFLILASPIFKVGWSDEVIAYVNNILIGIAVGLLGIIVTISFVQNALDKQATKNEKVEEYKKIVRYNKYLKILISEYMVYYNQVVTPVDKRGTDLDKGFVDAFTLKDMSGMYYNSIVIRDGFNTPVIKRFYEVEGNLVTYLLRWNEEIDFKYTPKLEAIINEFLTKSKELDTRENILAALDTRLGNEKLSEIITTKLTEDKEDYLARFNEGKLQSNVMTCVVFLFFFLNMQRECIKQLNSEISIIENELIMICD